MDSVVNRAVESSVWEVSIEENEDMEVEDTIKSTSKNDPVGTRSEPLELETNIFKIPYPVDKTISTSSGKSTITSAEKPGEANIKSSAVIESKVIRKQEEKSAVAATSSNYSENSANGKDTDNQQIPTDKNTERNKTVNETVRSLVPNKDGDSILIEVPSKPASMSVNSQIVDSDMRQRGVDIYTTDKGPKWYDVKGDTVTNPIIPKKLIDAYRYLPVCGRPKSTADLEEFQNSKIRDFVGSSISDEEFNNLAEYCNPDNLKTGKELMMHTNNPGHAPLLGNHRSLLTEIDEENQLTVVKRHKFRMESDSTNQYIKRLKYRGLRMMLLTQEDDGSAMADDPPLQPGKDLLFRVRIYRPFTCNLKERTTRGRHSIFSRDVVVLGRQTLTELRDRFACPNDAGMRVDVSDHPDDLPTTTARELFPSGFLFINNVFYVDRRAGCADHSARIRRWAAARGLGAFPTLDMADVRLEDLQLRLGHPEMYMHQGNCEHLFTFSEVRLLNATDPLSVAQYPCHTAISQNQSVYCTMCSEFGAKWIVVGCPRTPFNPAFYCDNCFNMYLYIDGKKIGDFKAYNYRGNELNMLKPQGH